MGALSAVFNTPSGYALLRSPPVIHRLKPDESAPGEIPGIFFRQFCYYLARSDGRAGHNHPFYPFYLFFIKALPADYCYSSHH
jgi:hypothetical protein